jgi:hypothetical protein
MPCMARCRVSVTDSEKLEHAVEVEAESLYEAVPLAVADFREDPLSKDAPGAMTEFTVAVLRNPTEQQDSPQSGGKMGGAFDEGGAGGDYEEAEGTIPARPALERGTIKARSKLNSRKSTILEINVCVQWLWDGGVEVKLGDGMNGFMGRRRANPTFLLPPGAK